MLQIHFLYAFNICQMINKFFLFSGKIFENRIVIQNRGKQMASLKLIINDNFYQLFKSKYTLLKLFWCLSKNCSAIQSKHLRSCGAIGKSADDLECCSAP